MFNTILYINDLKVKLMRSVSISTVETNPSFL